MKRELNLCDTFYDLKKDEIKLLVDTYKLKIAPSFENIDKETIGFIEDLKTNMRKLHKSPNEVREIVRDSTLDYYEKVSLMHYQCLAIWIVNLYQFWEQQVRLFLYEQMKNDFEIEFSFFATEIELIKKEFKNFEVNIEQLPSWEKINELRLLCNVIKHGDGKSAKNLRKINPALFICNGIELEEIDILNLYKTTLLKIGLNIEEYMIEEYGYALQKFWDNLHELC